MRIFETLRCESLRPGVMHLVLNRPARHNALDAMMIRELMEAAGLIGADPSIRAVVLAADGKSFCAGGDLGWMREQFDAAPEERDRQARALFAMLTALDQLPQLLIGAVQGPAYGGGVGLASVCDVVIAKSDARFALTETGLGLIPATIAPFLFRRIGQAGLRGIGLHGVRVDAAEARALGLVSELADDLEAAVERHLTHLLACAPGAVAEAKALFRALSSGTAGEAQVVAALSKRWQSREAQEGIAAFFAKEAPPWQTG
mgnify:CR=1 FL=1